MIEKISAELTNLSALYSAKCLENSQLDEHIQTILNDKNQQNQIR